MSHVEILVQSKGCFCDSAVCHPRFVFELYGEVNSAKNTTINV